jgi:hypothetical protein
MKPDATSPLATEELALAWLKLRIEDLSALPPMWSRSAYTHRRTPHVAFANGAMKPEGEEAAWLDGNVRDLAEATLQAVREYRRGIDGPVLLVWRCEPEVRREAGRTIVYCQLSLERDDFA